MSKEKINIWLDNNRPVPDGWIGCKSVKECLHAILAINLKTQEFNILSLDHDLGPGNATGTDFCEAFIKFPKYFPKEIYLHTANPKGKERMYRILSRKIKQNNLDTVLHDTRMAGTIKKSDLKG